MSIMHGSFQCMYVLYTIFFFSNDTATTEIYTLSLHDALPISLAANRVTDHSAGAVDNAAGVVAVLATVDADRKSTRLNSSHSSISYAVFCLKKKKQRDCWS